MKPFIGINLDISTGPPPEAKVQTTYADAIIQSGGIPILLFPMSDEDLSEVVNKLDGLMFIGGLDYCPSRYGEDRHETVEVINPRREDFDFRLISRALTNPDLSILGICGGAQLLNICLGGSLIQDIMHEHPESGIEHSSPDGWKKGFTRHNVNLVSGTKLASIYSSDSLAVPTSHHQAVRRAGTGLSVAAHADDGVAEAVEHGDRKFVLGVQWHPERDYKTNQPLFDAFVKSSSSNGAGNGSHGK